MPLIGMEEGRSALGALYSPTAASVCPLLFLTPPGVYRNGTTCPGRVKSSAPAFGSLNNLAVYARSCAEMPVVVGCLAALASMVRWYAVPFGSWDIPDGGRRGGRLRDFNREGGRETQMKPLPSH